jgi:hypothetical protein
MTPTIFWIKTDLPGRLATMPRPKGESLALELQELRTLGVDVVVSLLGRAEQTELLLDAEGDLCEGCSMTFLALPIEDRGLPTDPKEVGELANKLLKLLRDGKTVAIHCRMGIGRASLLAACVLILSGVSPEAAWKRIREARGCPVPDTEEQRKWVARFATSFSRR